MVTRMKPEARKDEILNAALVVATKLGFANVRVADIATQAGCGYGTVSYHFNTMTQMRRAMMRAAVERKILKIIAEGLVMRHPEAKKAPDDIQKKAIASFVK